ncbi:hypothetical protein LguiA_036144 [Lonicera macranthoides]
MANLTLQTSLFLFSSYLPYQFLRITPQTSTTTPRNQHFLIITPQTSSTIISQRKQFLVIAHSDKSSSPLLSLSSFTVEFLVNSCGLPLEDALSASKKLQLKQNNSQKYESVLLLLRSFHFSDTHITKLLIKFPKILQMKVNNVTPKLEYLRDNGFSGPLLPDLIVSNLGFLTGSLNRSIKPTLEFLKKYLQTNDKFVFAAKRTSRLRTTDLKGTTERNIEFLLSEGVTATGIETLVLLQVRTLVHRLDRIVYAVRTVKELGLDPTTPKCVEAIRVLLSMNNSTWNRKLHLFKSLGWSEEEIWSVFKRQSICLALSEENIRRTVDFYVNTMKLKPEVLASRPSLLCYALNRRIRPRYNIIQVLESRKLLKKKFKITTLFRLPEKVFLEKFVDKHLDQIPNLLEVYRGTIMVEKMDQLEPSNLNALV